jgi:hypothetical protein
MKKRKLVKPPRWPLVALVDHYGTDVTREASDDEYDGDDLAHDASFAGVRLCAGKEAGDLAVAFEPKPGMEVFVVCVRYSTGDSFHHETGLFSVAAAFSDEQHALWCKAAIEDGKESFGLCVYAEDGSLTRLEVNWAGYFERVESCDIHRAVIPEPAKKPGSRP